MKGNLGNPAIEQNKHTEIYPHGSHTGNNCDMRNALTAIMPTIKAA